MFIEEHAMYRTIPIIVTVALAALTACAVGPAYQHPPMELPRSFRGAAEIGAGSATSTDGGWWAGFHDPLLTQIIERTLAQNLDLAAAAARVNQARAAAALAGAALLPEGDLAASASSARDSLTSPLGKIAHAVGAPRNYQTYSAGAQASWEVDLFGSVRRRRDAARDDAEAAETGQAAIRIALSAEAADAYLELRGLQAQLTLAKSQEETQSRLVDLVRLRLGQGVSSDREWQRANAELERVRALEPALRAAIDAEIYRLDVLMGTPAGTHYDELALEAEQPTAPQPVGSVAPADLMQRRPDIAAAERHLAAANARIGAAIAEYYPHLTFSGLTGFESVDAGSLFTAAAQQSGALIGLRWRLFDFGRVDAEVAIARGRDREALAAYRGTVLRATEDVEAALSQFIESRTEAQVLRREIAALMRAREEAQTAYEGGVLPLLEVLDADRDLLAARDRLAAANAGEARAAVASFRALGGGWGG
jgi:NodT family efflux transporter outer membrane factor (OMF) lipoprotein